MPPSPAQPRPSSRSDRSAVSRGFTLIELLTVVAIIGILATITFNVMGGVQRHSMTVRAQAELAAIGTALEQFKLQYGDYPRTDRATDLFDALTGKKGPTMATITGKTFLSNLTKYSLTNPDNIDTAGTNVILDPWGIEYHYIYKAPAGSVASWANPSYVLFSSGPDEKFVSPLVDNRGNPASLTATESLDNLYANHP